MCQRKTLVPIRSSSGCLTSSAAGTYNRSGSMACGDSTPSPQQSRKDGQWYQPFPYGNLGAGASPSEYLPAGGRDKRQDTEERRDEKSSCAVLDQR